MNVSGYPRPRLGQVKIAHVPLGHGRKAPAALLDPLGLRGRWCFWPAHLGDRTGEWGCRGDRCGYRGCRDSRHRGWCAQVAGTPLNPAASTWYEPLNNDVGKAVGIEGIAQGWRKLPHPLRWVVAATVGSTLVVMGVIMLFIPGPGIAFIVAGLAVLATEFVWAEALLHRVKDGGNQLVRKIRRKPQPPTG